jgi:hypothetical protein
MNIYGVLLLLVATLFLLGNSAGGLGGLALLAGGAIIGLGVIIGSIFAIIKFFVK